LKFAGEDIASFVPNPKDSLKQQQHTENTTLSGISRKLLASLTNADCIQRHYSAQFLYDCSLMRKLCAPEISLGK
jgi:hypothetical protein